VQHSPLIAIVDVDVATRAAWPPLDLARAYMDGGARLLQVRAKQVASAPFLELCEAVVASARPYDASVIINDRVDVARLSGAAGVHLGQEDLPATAARQQLGAQSIVGLSTHTVEQIEDARREPISYVAVGPIFGTATKDTGYDAVGLELVKQAVARVGAGLPVVAIGGITLERVRLVTDAGATSVAVISDLLTGGSPMKRVQQYLRALG